MRSPRRTEREEKTSGASDLEQYHIKQLGKEDTPAKETEGMTEGVGGKPETPSLPCERASSPISPSSLSVL